MGGTSIEIIRVVTKRRRKCALLKSRTFACIFSVIAASGIALESSAADIPNDPLRSSQWETMYKLYFKGVPVEFDGRVKVLAPQTAENSLEVPILVDITNLNDVQQILVIADLNPLPKVLEFFPEDVAPRIGFRIKLQQASPLRAAARTGDGRWHIGGVWIDAAGGGCTLPSMGSSNPRWESHLGEIKARLWPRERGGQRLRFTLLHPMDTGLAPGIPAFYAESIDLFDARGKRLARIKPHEPIAENPLFTLDLPRITRLKLYGRDNDGNTFGAEITP